MSSQHYHLTRSSSVTPSECRKENIHAYWNRVIMFRLTITTGIIHKYVDECQSKSIQLYMCMYVQCIVFGLGMHGPYCNASICAAVGLGVPKTSWTAGRDSIPSVTQQRESHQQLLTQMWDPPVQCALRMEGRVGPPPQPCLSLYSPLTADGLGVQ